MKPKELNIYSMKAPHDEVSRAHPESVVRNLALYYNVSESEIVERLHKSDIDHPIEYYDQIFWCDKLCMK